MSENKLNIQSMESTVRDEFELADLVYTNGTTGKEHIFSIWHDIDDITDEKMTLSDLQDSALYVFIHDPSFNYSDYDSLQDGLENNLQDYLLSDLITYDEALEKQLVDYYNGNIEEFNIEIPENEQSTNIDSIIIDQEIINVLMKSELDQLEKSDLVELGKSMEDVDLKYNFNFPKQENFPMEFDIENNFNKALVVTNITQEEIPFLNKTFENLNLEPYLDFSENIDKFNENEIPEVQTISPEENDWSTEYDYYIEKQQQGADVSDYTAEDIKKMLNDKENKEESKEDKKTTNKSDEMGMGM